MDTKPSKSARKREYLALQELGEQLIGLTPAQLDSIDLDERLREAVIDARSIQSHGALRRQKQLIGKLMRSVEPGPIRSALEALGRSDQQSKRVFREAESWRDRIVADEPGALEDFAEHLGRECEALVTEVGRFRSAVDERGRKQARRRIFRIIHSEIEGNVLNDPRSI